MNPTVASLQRRSLLYNDILMTLRKGRKIAFIVNPLSGGKDKGKIIASVKETMQREGFSHEIFMTERPGHATEIARSCDADVVVATGGDGTVSEVAQGLAGTEKILGIIPCGSGDGLALHLGISRNPRKALGTVCETCVCDMDYGLVNGKAFFCTTGVGLDAEVARRFAEAPQRGLRTYISEAWKTWRDFVPDTYVIEIDGTERWRGPAVFVTVGNAGQWGNGAKITPLASVSDGLLDVTVVEPFRTVEIPLLAALLMTGRANRSRRARCFRGERVTIRRGNGGAAHFDGDPCIFGTEITAEVRPSALRVLVPSSNKDSI